MKKKTKKQALPPGAIMSARQRQQLELEVVSSEARLMLTRLLRNKVKSTSSEEGHKIELIWKNQVVNLTSTILGRPIYTLELSDWDYDNAEYAWHNGEFELAMRRPNTPQLFEALIDLVNEGFLSITDVNQILEFDKCGARLDQENDKIVVRLIDLVDLPDETSEKDTHVNIRLLIERMDRALQDKDWPLVLHSGASVFESLAKQTVPNQNIQNQSFGGWFSLYRNHSKLAAPLLDAIKEIFDRRNIEPLAGHGSISNPSITQEEAIQVRVLTIALVRLERTLSEVSVTQHS